MIPLDGPFYDQLSVGDELPRQPGITIDSGLAALNQSLFGERLALTLDAELCEAVTGRPGRLASPGLVMQVSIGQSTTISRRAIANLFYRDVRLARPVFLDETLRTVVTVAGLADGSSNFHYRGLGDRIFAMVFRRIYGVEIERVSAATIEDDFKKELDSARRQAAWHKG